MNKLKMFLGVVLLGLNIVGFDVFSMEEDGDGRFQDIAAMHRLVLYVKPAGKAGKFFRGDISQEQIEIINDSDDEATAFFKEEMKFVSGSYKPTLYEKARIRLGSVSCQNRLSGKDEYLSLESDYLNRLLSYLRQAGISLCQAQD